MRTRKTMNRLAKAGKSAADQSEKLREAMDKSKPFMKSESNAGMVRVVQCRTTGRLTASWIGRGGHTTAKVKMAGHE